MTQSEPTRIRCLACRTGELFEASQERIFNPGGRTVKVQLLISRCNQCKAETVLASQHRENLARLAARKSEYGNVLMGEEILAFRKRYGIKQKDASRMFGKGPIAFSRYETETTYPDASTTKLLQMAIKRMDFAKELADLSGVTLPLWQERVEDEKRIKLIALPRQPVQAPKAYKHIFIRLDSDVPKGIYRNSTMAISWTKCATRAHSETAIVSGPSVLKSAGRSS